MTHEYAHHEIPGIAAITPGEGDLPKIRITTPEATAEIYLHGAQLTAWQPAHSGEVLFLSKQSGFGPGKAIRGGIPICFPWFGPLSGPKADDPQAPKHGTVRLKAWHLDAITHKDDQVRVSLSTENDADSEKWFPHSFRLEHHITIGHELTLDLVAHNTGPTPCTISEAQHTYYHVGSIHQVSVDGLDGASYLDNNAGNQEFAQTGPITVTKPTDNAYQHTTNAVTLNDPGLNRRIHVHKSGSDSTIVWNPWQQATAQMADLGNDDWLSFLCIEAANMRTSSVEIPAGQSHTMQTRVLVDQD